MGQRQQTGQESRGNRTIRKAIGIYAAVAVLCFGAGALRMAVEKRTEPLEERLRTEEEIYGAVLEGTVDSSSEKDGILRIIIREGEISVPGKWGKEDPKNDKTSGKSRKNGRNRAKRQNRERISAGSVYVTLKVGTEGESEGETVASDLPDSGQRESRPGERLRISGSLSLFETATNPGQFDYRTYYRGLGIRYRMQADEMESMGEAEGVSPVTGLGDTVKRSATQAIDTVCLPEDRGFFRAVLLGDRTALPKEDRKLFQDGGISHILAVSGLHVSLIGMTVYTLLRRCGAGFGAAGSIAGLLLLLYGSIAGFGASVFRAVVMMIFSMIANRMGRTYDLLSALAAALLMLALDSPFLIYSSGLQLSFGAVFGIGVLSDRSSRRNREEILKQKKRWRDRVNGGGRQNFYLEAFRIGAAIQLFTLPLILWHFFNFPAIGLFLNPIVIPLMTFLAGSGLFAVGLGFAGAYLPAEAVLAPGHYIYHFYRFLCGAAEQAEFLRFTPGRPALWMVCGYYALIMSAFYMDEIQNAFKTMRKWGSKPRGRWAECLLVGTAVLALLCPRPVHGLEVTFLDVRQGDGVILRHGGRTWISDCGSTQDRNAGERRLVPFLKSQGVTYVEAAMLSHADADHVNAVQYLLKENTGIRIGKLILPSAARGSEKYDTITALAENVGTPVEYMAEGDVVGDGDFRMVCMHPRRGEHPDPSEANDHCLAFRVEYGNLRMILTADLPAEHETEILGDVSEGESKPVTGPQARRSAAEKVGEEDNRTVILKAGHHGSRTSTSEALLRAARPDLVIISCGKHNSYGHPADETLERIRRAGSLAMDTEYDGAITVRSDGTETSVESFCW